MKVRGIYKEEITVDVSQRDLFDGLLQYFGLYDVFNPDYDYYWEESHDSCGNLCKLTEKKDTSYHGSSHYEPTGNEITDKDTLDAYLHLQVLKVLISNKENHERNSD